MIGWSPVINGLSVLVSISSILSSARSYTTSTEQATDDHPPMCPTDAIKTVALATVAETTGPSCPLVVFRRNGLHLDSVNGKEAREPGVQVFWPYTGLLVDLVRFELTTSSMPCKTFQSLTDNRARNTRLTRRRFGRQWTPKRPWTPRGHRTDTNPTPDDLAFRLPSRAVVTAVWIFCC
jgi:hypothetical protein